MKKGPFRLVKNNPQERHRTVRTSISTEQVNNKKLFDDNPRSSLGDVIWVHGDSILQRHQYLAIFNKNQIQTAVATGAELLKQSPYSRDLSLDRFPITRLQGHCKAARYLSSDDVYEEVLLNLRGLTESYLVYELEKIIEHSKRAILAKGDYTKTLHAKLPSGL